MNNKDSDQTYDEHMQKILDSACEKVKHIKFMVTGENWYQTTDNKIFRTLAIAERHQYDLDRGNIKPKKVYFY